MKANEKQKRLENANALIQIIASYGRRFFWHGGVNRWNPDTKTATFEPADRYARLELRRGRVYLIDDYTEKVIYTHHTTFGNEWHGFSHGGTLRSLVEDMRDYILHGTPIPRWNAFRRKHQWHCAAEAKSLQARQIAINETNSLVRRLVEPVTPKEA